MLCDQQSPLKEGLISFGQNMISGLIFEYVFHLKYEGPSESAQLKCNQKKPL